jgi:hypothetical protein
MTTAKRATAKELALSAIKSLPDDADLDDIIEEIIVFHTLQERLERTDQEPTFTQEEVARQMAEWRDR